MDDDTKKAVQMIDQRLAEHRRTQSEIAASNEQIADALLTIATEIGSLATAIEDGHKVGR